MNEIDYGLKEMNEMHYVLNKMNEMKYREMYDICDKNRGDASLSDDVML